jgi:hypothetical protein
MPLNAVTALNGRSCVGPDGVHSPYGVDSWPDAPKRRFTSSLDYVSQSTDGRQQRVGVQLDQPTSPLRILPKGQPGLGWVAGATSI